MRKSRIMRLFFLDYRSLFPHDIFEPRSHHDAGVHLE